MNISMLDMYSLAWKLNLIEKGVGNRKILINSYEQERRGVALELLDFDARYSSLFSGKAAEDGKQDSKPSDLSIDPDVFIEMFKKSKRKMLMLIQLLSSTAFIVSRIISQFLPPEQT